MSTIAGVAWVAACYLVGGISTGTLVVRWLKGIDIRDVGSGGAGGTNVGSVLGLRGMLGVGVVDFAKAVMVVWVGAVAGAAPVLLYAGGLATVAGNVLPIQHGWRGGKGVATSLGVLVVVAPAAGVWLLCVGLAAGLLARDRMVGGAVAYGLLPAAALLPVLDPAEMAWLTGVAALVLWALRRPRRGVR